MFENDFKNIFLDDYTIYFLAKELKIEQLIGFGIDFNIMNKELKNEIKQECYDYMLKEGIITMDFSGDTVVSDEYKNIVASFESPSYCCIIQEINIEEDTSSQRKVFQNGNKFTALDYIDESTSAVYEFSEAKKTNSFVFLDTNICNINIDELKSETIANVENEISNSKKCVIITEYIAGKENYEAIQKIYLLKEEWYEIDADENGNTLINKVLYPVSIDV